MPRIPKDLERACRSALRKRGLLVHRERDNRTRECTGYVVVLEGSQTVVAGAEHALSLQELMLYCGGALAAAAQTAE